MNIVYLKESSNYAEKTFSEVLCPSEKGVLCSISSYLSLHCTAFYLKTLYSKVLLICIPTPSQLYFTSLLVDCKLFDEGFKTDSSLQPDKVHLGQYLT